MDGINNSYEKIDKEISMYFESKHEKLIKEEKDMKEKLQIEVTKIKAKLEEYLTVANDLLKKYERINKGIKSFNNEEKNNDNFKILKNLTYISKINTNKKKMNDMTKLLMKNLKIDFIENNVKYEEYFFNGLPIPKNVTISEIDSNNFKLSWEIDDKRILNIEKTNIIYKVEIRKENDEFKLSYKGNDRNCNINNLYSNTNYEVKICSIYNNISSKWSEVEKVKTKKVNVDSIILNESKRSDEFMNKLYEWIGGKKLELLYRGSRDGMSNEIFHNKCNNQGPTISLIKSEKDYIFGGYASIDWTSYGNYRKAPESFIFTLTNMYNIELTKFPNSDPNYSIGDDTTYGPVFGNCFDICIQFPSSHQINFPKSYDDVLGKGKSIFTGDNKVSNFNLKEIEVFKLIK